VELLRNANKGISSLVATVDGKVVGHILFSLVTVESNPHNLKGLGLAPIAVFPQYQNRGIGSGLVIQGLETCRNKGYAFVVVVGHETFYVEFGFERASRFGLSNEYGVDEGFMALELREGALKTVRGIVKYQPEFNLPKVSE
jgi:putative acetyltransferase